MLERISAEVDRQHGLLARWLGSAAGPEVLDELRSAHTGDFTMVNTDGHPMNNRELFEALGGARDSAPGLRILISHVELVAELGEAVLARFLETHVAHGHTSSRRVSAVFVPDPAAPHGLRWRYLHETAIPG